MAVPLDQCRHPHLHTPRADSPVQTEQLGQLAVGMEDKMNERQRWKTKGVVSE